MLRFTIQDISRNRKSLMGIATILILIVHMPDNGVVMPEVLKKICALGSLGVDLFLLLSGFGLWYSLDNKFRGKPLTGGYGTGIQ